MKSHKSEEEDHEQTGEGSEVELNVEMNIKVKKGRSSKRSSN